MTDHSGAFQGSVLTKRSTWLEWAGLAEDEDDIPSNASGLDYTGDISGISSLLNDADDLAKVQGQSSRPVSGASSGVNTSVSSLLKKTKTPLQRAKPTLLTILRCILAANTQVGRMFMVLETQSGFFLSSSPLFSLVDKGLRGAHGLLRILLVRHQHVRSVQQTRYLAGLSYPRGSLPPGNRPDVHPGRGRPRAPGARHTHHVPEYHCRMALAVLRAGLSRSSIPPPPFPRRWWSTASWLTAL